MRGLPLGFPNFPPVLRHVTGTLWLFCRSEQFPGINVKPGVAVDLPARPLAPRDPDRAEATGTGALAALRSNLASPRHHLLRL